MSGATRSGFQPLRWVSEDGPGTTGLATYEDECRALDAVGPLPVDGEAGIRFFSADGLGIPIACGAASPSFNRHRPDRARPSCLPRLLQARLPEAVRDVVNCSASPGPRRLEQKHCPYGNNATAGTSILVSYRK
jgi:hypothetical protein